MSDKNNGKAAKNIIGTNWCLSPVVCIHLRQTCSKCVRGFTSPSGRRPSGGTPSGGTPSGGNYVVVCLMWSSKGVI